jgi:hypothetical protein
LLPAQSAPDGGQLIRTATKDELAQLFGEQSNRRFCMNCPLPTVRTLGIVALLATVSLAAMFGFARDVSADPSFGYGGLGPGVNSSIFDTANGSPVFAAPAAVPAYLPPAIGLGVAANTDALAFGDDVFPPGAPWHLAYTVGPGATGSPLTPPPISPMYPNIPAELAAGDGAVVADIYSSFAMPAPAGTFGAFPAVGPPPCGPVQNNIQSADEDGLGPFALGFPNVGLDALPLGINVDTLEIDDTMLVDFIPPGGDGILDAPVFFSVDPATAAALPALPPFFVATTPADVLAWAPGFGLVNWAPAFMLGLGPGDDIDGLAVGYVSGAPVPGGWVGPPDTILFSLAPASPILGALPSLCFGPGTASPGDIVAKFVPGAAPPVPTLDAEMIGLNTLRTGGLANDNLEDFDIAMAFGIDTDGDLIDDGPDFDDDSDGLGDLFDLASGCSPVLADTDGDGTNDYQEVVVAGTSCALADTDGDGCTDTRELQVAPGSQVSGGLRDPLNFNDYFNPSGDLMNRIDDIVLVLNQYFMDDDAATPGSPPYAPGYNPNTDRTFTGPNPWNSGPPNGLQRIDDIVNQLRQYFHDCV